MAGNILVVVESIFRIILGLRFLSSGITNVRRWPHATETAAIVFPRGSYFFGLVATVLMVVGGAGLTVGIQTPISAFMLIIFLIPTFRVHQYWLETLPAKVRAVKESIASEDAKREFRIFERQAIHSHEVGWQDNLVLLAGCLYFAVRGCIAYGVDNLVEHWVVRLF